MDFYKEYESTIKKLFMPEDLVIARMLKEALDRGRGQNETIYSVLAYASGNLKTRFPNTSDVLFQFVKFFERTL